MGKHKEKRKKSKKDKRKTKKSKHKKYSTSSSDSSEEEIWVEKSSHSTSSDDETKKIKHKRKHSSSSNSDQDIHDKPSTSKTIDDRSVKRDDWMSLPTSFETTSHLERRREREENKKQEKEKQQYNPRECTRELNPYWKNGGDGLPTFKKPSEDNHTHNKRDFINRNSGWRKKNEEIDRNSKKIDSKPDENLSENTIAAKLVKAEIMGNTKLIEQLKKQLENARKSNDKSQNEEEDVILTHTDRQGRSLPYRPTTSSDEPLRRKKNTETHTEGQRIRYFADDDKYSLKEMFENEKYNSVEDNNKEFLKMTTKRRRNDDLDDIFEDNARKTKKDPQNTQKAIYEHEKLSETLRNCSKCIQSASMPKHLIISTWETIFLCVPPHEPLTEGHCVISTVRHAPCVTQLDENEWAEILDMRKALVRMFRSRNEDVVFFETARWLHRQPHLCIECVPLPKETGDLAPIYFKKAIDESETEWAQNKKLVSLKGRDVRRAVPKGLPYFWVSFGMDEGYAHVIEEEALFPGCFAQEIVGGMLDLDHSRWRKPKRESFDEQKRRVVEFSRAWKEFDCSGK